MTPQSPLTRWSRMGAMFVAWLFSAGIVIQIFLAGLALFDTPARWLDHKDFGYMIGILPVLTLVLVVLGRLPAPIIGMTAVMVVLYGVQTALPNLDFDYIAALHPLVAFVLLGMSGQLGTRIRCATAPSPDSTGASSRDATSQVTP